MPEMGFPGNRLWDEVHVQDVSGEGHWNDTCVQEGSEAGTNTRRGHLGCWPSQTISPGSPGGPNSLQSCPTEDRGGQAFIAPTRSAAECGQPRSGCGLP